LSPVIESLLSAKNVILIAILALGAWALSPPPAGKKTATLGTSAPANAPPAKYVIRFHPGPLYLPGVVPENATRPIEGIKKVGEAFSKIYPDTRVDFVGVPSGSREWLVTQLSSGQAPDVIMVNVEDVWQDIQKNWYVPIDRYLDAPNPFVEKGKPGSVKWWDMFKYPIPTRGTAAPDGQMYCIVLDMIETGIYYNKSIFNKLGLSEPRDWNEFIDIQRKLKDAGYIPMLVDRTYLADWGADLTFEQMYGSMRDLIDLDYDPKRGEYLHGYLDWDEIIFLHRKGFFSPRDPRWREVWRILKEWRPFMCRDLNNEGTDFFRLFATEKGAMYWSHAMIVPRLVKDPDRKFDWGIFYLPPVTKQVSRFADGHDQCVIGGSGMQYSVTNSSYRDTGDPATSERLKRVIAFLQFLTLPENCDTVVNEQIALLPNIVGVDPHPELLPFDGFLQRRYAMTKWFYTFDLRFGEVLLRMLEMHLNDGLTEEQFLDLMDRELTRAGETIVKRKSPDMERFERIWKEREPRRATFNELPR
jgi:ABC-type glycerol-3-phosphate transport system substrate-binding protein